MHTKTTGGNRRLGTAMFLATGIVAILSTATPAQAHFILQSPQAYSTQPGGYNTPPYGGAQKSGACGQNDAGFATNGVVHNFTAGQMITLTVLETIPHPGHYRVAIAQDIASLPVDPTVNPMGGDQCGMIVLDGANPKIIADQVFKHTASFGNNPQTMQIKLPDGFTCQNCMLQVIEYMSNHTAPCFYRHCATVNITNGPVPDMAGTMPAPDLATPTEMPPPTMPEGCSYSGAHRQVPTLLHFAPLLLLGLLARRRRRCD